MNSGMIYLDERAESRNEVVERGSRAATGFAKMGILEGDTVALLLRNDFAFFEVLQATNAIGAYAVPINWHGKSEEVCYVLNDAKPKVLIAHADLLKSIRNQLPTDIYLLVVPTPIEIQKRYGIPQADCQVTTAANWSNRT